MDCERMREVLVEHVDGLLDAEGAEGARHHLASCDACCDLREEVRRNFAAMDAWGDEDLPEGAWDRLVDRLPGVRPPVGVAAGAAGGRPSWGRRFGAAAFPYVAGLATAAALLMAFYPDRADPTGDPGQRPPAVRPPAGIRTVPVADTDPTPRPFNRGSGAANLREGERALEFGDVGLGVHRRIILPRDIDPARVMPLRDLDVQPASGGVR